MSVVESGRPPSKWSQFWFGALQLLSCGVCSREAVDPLPSTRENSEQYSIEPSGEEATVPHTPTTSQAEHQPFVQPSVDSMCLMDLPDDCLLEIIDRLSFLDRLRFRVNKRLYALEPHATAIANESDRFDINTIHVEVNGDQAWFRVGQRRDWPRADYFLTLPLIDGVHMLRRIIKCCTIRRDFSIEGVYENQNFAMSSLVSCIRRNHFLTDLHLIYPSNWATTDQISMLIMEAGRLSLRNFTFIDMSLSMAQELVEKLMGMRPSILENPPSDFSTIRTTIKDKEIYVISSVDTQHVYAIMAKKESMNIIISINMMSENCQLYKLSVGKWYPHSYNEAVRVTHIQQE